MKTNPDEIRCVLSMEVEVKIVAKDGDDLDGLREQAKSQALAILALGETPLRIIYSDAPQMIDPLSKVEEAVTFELNQADGQSLIKIDLEPNEDGAMINAVSKLPIDPELKPAVELYGAMQVAQWNAATHMLVALVCQAARLTGGRILRHQLLPGIVTELIMFCHKSYLLGQGKDGSGVCVEGDSGCMTSTMGKLEDILQRNKDDRAKMIARRALALDEETRALMFDSMKADPELVSLVLAELERLRAAAE